MHIFVEDIRGVLYLSQTYLGSELLMVKIIGDQKFN